jgi:PAS domain S-box-containing protein
VTDARAEVERMARRLERPDSAVVGTDIGGRIVFWNEGAECLYGWPAADVMGRDITDIPVRSVDGSLVGIVGVSRPVQIPRS